MARRRLKQAEKQIIYIAVLLVLAALGLWRTGTFEKKRHRKSSSDPVAFKTGAPAKVDYVIDGDTFDAIVEVPGSGTEAERVRMLRINTPELEQPGYKEATDELARLLTAKNVILETDEGAAFERDQYGRLLAYVFVNGKNVNIEMVRSGWTRFYTRFGEGVYAKAFREAEAEARSARRGLWALD